MTKDEAKAAGEKVLARVNKFCNDAKLVVTRYDPSTYDWHIEMCNNTVRLFCNQIDAYTVRQLKRGKHMNWHFTTGRTPLSAFKKYRNIIQRHAIAYDHMLMEINFSYTGE